MKIEGFYQRLCYIIDIYSDDGISCEFNIYTLTDMEKMLGCYNPSLTLKKVGEQVNVAFKGDYNYYLNYETRKYNITVSSNDIIKSNVPLSQRNVLDAIVYYIRTKVYAAAENKKLRDEAERMRDNRIMNEKNRLKPVTDMAREILFALGSVYRTDSDNDSSVTQACTYEGYGLKITAYDLPGYDFSNKLTDGYIDSMKQYMDKIQIKYNDITVFDSNSLISNDGIWNDIFNELYKKYPVLKAEKDKAYQDKLHCNKLLKDVISPLYSLCYGKVNDTLAISSYSRPSFRYNNCGSREDDYYYSVYKNGVEVLKLISVKWRDYDVLIYKPGEWEQELKDSLDEFSKRKGEEETACGMEYLRKLRELK